MAEAERRAQALSEENASLVLELNQRPSVKQVHGLQRQVQALQRQLARLRGSGQDQGPAAPEHAPASIGERAAGLLHEEMPWGRAGPPARIHSNKECLIMQSCLTMQPVLTMSSAILLKE